MPAHRPDVAGVLISTVGVSKFTMLIAMLLLCTVAEVTQGAEEVSEQVTTSPF